MRTFTHSPGTPAQKRFDLLLGSIVLGTLLLGAVIGAFVSLAWW
jgi:hypothetical protein